MKMFALKFFSAVLLLVLASISLHGFVGAFLSMERAVYCTISEIIVRTVCPERSEPIARSVFNASVFKDLSQTRNRTQIFFDMLLSLEVSRVATASLALPVVLLVLSFWYAYALHNLIPPDFASRLKLRRWSRQLAQSPAVLRA